MKITNKAFDRWLLFFSLGLPIGPLVSFGAQLLRAFLDITDKAPINYLGPFCMATGMVVLLFFVYFASDYKDLKNLIRGFAVGFIIQMPLVIIATFHSMGAI